MLGFRLMLLTAFTLSSPPLLSPSLSIYLSPLSISLSHISLIYPPIPSLSHFHPLFTSFLSSLSLSSISLLSPSLSHLSPSSLHHSLIYLSPLSISLSHISLIYPPMTHPFSLTFTLSSPPSSPLSISLSSISLHLSLSSSYLSLSLP